MSIHSYSPYECAPICITKPERLVCPEIEAPFIKSFEPYNTFQEQEKKEKEEKSISQPFNRNTNKFIDYNTSMDLPMPMEKEIMCYGNGIDYINLYQRSIEDNYYREILKHCTDPRESIDGWTRLQIEQTCGGHDIYTVASNDIYDSGTPLELI